MGSNPEYIAIRAEKTATHGQKRRSQMSREYRTWLGIKRRCYDTKCKDYEVYGSRGIIVCDRWNGSFENFFADMGPKPTPRHQIDRKNPNGNYEPTNCRWVTPYVQGSENKRTLTSITVDGQFFHSLGAASDHFGVGRSTMVERIKAGISPIDAVSLPAWSETPRRTRESYLPKSHPDRATSIQN